MTRLGITTPFGRRPASLGRIAAAMELGRDLTERQASPGNHPAAVDKWRLHRTLTALRERLGLSDRSLALLQALLSFHPETALTLPKPPEDADAAPTAATDLVVFPSNRQLAQRAQGMAEKTIRRHIAALVDAGLILRRDSPNGKRYARRADGEAERFSEAYGFDLTPLVLRAHAFEAMLEDLRRDERRKAVLKEQISLRRRDIAKLLAMAFEEELPGPWDELRLAFLGLLTPLRRLSETNVLESVAEALKALAQQVETAVTSVPRIKDMTGNDGDFDRHQSISKTDAVSEFEPAVKTDRGGEDHAPETKGVPESRPDGLDPCPLGLVREACPDVVDYAPDAAVRDWGQLIAAARSIRPMLGISPDAWREAVAEIGERPAAVAVALILQRSEWSSEAETRLGEGGRVVSVVNGSPAVRSPGGYLRALTLKARAGEFALGPILMATVGQRLKARRAKGEGGGR